MRAVWKLPCISLVLPLAYTFTILFFFLPSRKLGGHGYNNVTHTEEPWIRSTSGIDSIIFIALGPAAISSSLLYALSSLREQGLWDGPVHVIVQDEGDLNCLASHLRQSVTTIVAPSGSRDDGTATDVNGGAGRTGEAMNAKLMKMKLLDLLPPSLERVLYIDCDIITQRPLGGFLDMVRREWDKVDKETAKTVAPGSNGTHNNAVDSRSTVPSTLLIFPDAGGHTIPLCRGCDLGHSGVVGLARSHSKVCLQLWNDAFMGSGSGETGTDTDQAALGMALRKDSGCKARWLDRRHLHFMKDPFVVWGMRGTSTFGHYTSLLHPERLSRWSRKNYERTLGRSFEEWGEGAIKECAF